MGPVPDRHNSIATSYTDWLDFVRKISACVFVALLIAAIAPNIPYPGNASIAVAQTPSATTTDRLNLRGGPALSYPVIAVIPLAASVSLNGQETNGFQSVTWSGQSGWAFGTYLSIDTPAPAPSQTATTTDRLNLRREPSLSGAVITVLPIQAIVTLTGESRNGFRQVTWGAYSGWVSTDYLSSGGSTPPPPVVTPSPNGQTTENVNLRTGPGLQHSVIRVVPNGTRVVLTGQSSNGFRSVSVNGTTGWLSADYVVADAAAPAPTEKVTTTDRLNLRSGPNTTSAVLAVIPNGASVELTGQSSNGFRSVSYAGRKGWAFEAYLTIPATPPPPPPPPVVEDAPFDVTNTIIGPARGSAEQALEYARQRGALRMDQVTLYITEIYRRAPQVGFDPALLVAQSALETNYWRSDWWVNRLNPAGIGINGDPAQEAASAYFASGTISARAQLAHMHAEVIGNRLPLPPVLQGVDPTYQRVFAAGWAGTIVTLEDLSGTWAVDPRYHEKIVVRAIAIFGQ